MKKRISLTNSQKAALEVLEGTAGNIFLTGGPGTGKSYLVREFLKRSDHPVPIIASTGAAAILVGGRTFHSFFGLGILQGGPEAVLKRAHANGRLRRRLKKSSTIIIDEVSMLSQPTLDCAELVAREIREDERPWGGMRIIAVGDFAQLPPITRAKEKEWGFLGRAWECSDFKTLELNEVVRTDDREFLEVLEELRWGHVTERVIDFLNDRLLSPEEVEVDVPHVFPRRAQTEAFNRARLEENPQPLKTFKTEYGGPAKYIEVLMRDAPIPPILELKKNALVMLRINDPKQRFVNGTVGHVLDFDEEMIKVDVQGRCIEIGTFAFSVLDEDGKEAAYALNFPVTLAYASTIHKVQGTTLDRVHVNLRSLWEPGQAYVALSRARSAKGVSVMAWDAGSIKADPVVQRFYDALTVAG